MSDLPDEGDKSNSLPAKDLCNKFDNPNPIYGKGALGNQNSERMYYSGADTKQLVETLQRMLLELGYDLGTSGPRGDGVDGTFGDLTERAVIDFQEKNKGWDGEPLRNDGLVGPRTSDALNRAMVGRWYQHYQTPEELVEGKPYHTVTTDFLKRSLSVEPKEAKEAKIFLIGDIPAQISSATLTIRLVNGNFEPLVDASYALEIDDPDFERITGVTNEKGILSHEIPRRAERGRLILGEITFNLIIMELKPANSVEGAFTRLSNLGYIIKEDLPVSEAASEKDVDKELLSAALEKFQNSHNLDASGEINKPTAKKLEEVYGC